MSTPDQTKRMKILGAFIKNLREQRELSQADVAKRLGIGRTGYSALEVGRVPISLEHLRVLAECLDVTVEMFAAVYAFPNRDQKHKFDWSSSGLQHDMLRLLSKIITMDSVLATNTEKVVDILLGRDRHWSAALRKTTRN